MTLLRQHQPDLLSAAYVQFYVIVHVVVDRATYPITCCTLLGRAVLVFTASSGSEAAASDTPPMLTAVATEPVDGPANDDVSGDDEAQPVVPAATVPSDDKVLQQGWLQKQAVSARFFKPWARRLVTVRPGSISWEPKGRCGLSNGGESTPAAARTMSLVGASYRAIVGKPQCISVTGSDGRELRLWIDDVAQANIWASAIATAAGAPPPLLEDFGDVAHSTEARALATASANSERGAFHSTLFVRTPPGWITCERWTECYGVVADGVLSLHVYRGAPLPFQQRVLRSGGCAVDVAELEACRAGHYCFRLTPPLPSECGDCLGDASAADHAKLLTAEGGALTLCAASSHEQLVWLQALVKSGARYVDEPTSASGSAGTGAGAGAGAGAGGGSGASPSPPPLNSPPPPPSGP